MLIKIRKGVRLLLVGMAILLLVVGLSFDKQQFVEEVFETLEHVNAQDWGYSSLKGLFGLPTLIQLGNTPSQITTGLVVRFPTYVAPRLPNIILSKLHGFPGRPVLERIDIEIKFLEYKKILEDRKRAIKDQILTHPHEVKAKINYKGRQIKANLRLKGDLSDHWRSKKRMSFRVSLKSDFTINGFKRFSLHSPGSRQHPYDQIFQEFVRNVGSLSARHDYVRVFVNGTNWGIMNIEEHMSKEFLEKQQAKESLIIRFGDDQKWRYRKKNKNTYQNYLISDPRFFNSVYQSRKYLKNPLARARYSYIAEMYLAGKLEKIADVDSLSRTAMVTAIWNNFHVLDNHNTRYYLNPYNLKLEPITTDQGPFMLLKKNKNPLSRAQGLFKAALTSQEGRLQFNDNLEKILEVSDKLDALISYYDRFFPNDYPVDYSVLRKNIGTFSKFVAPVISEPHIGKKYESSVVTPPSKKQAEKMPAHIHVRHYNDGKLVLYNLLPIPVQLSEIRFEGRKLEIAIKEVPSSKNKDGLVIIETGLTGYQDDAFEVVTSFLGFQRTAKNDFTYINQTVNPLGRPSNIANLKFIEKYLHGYIIKRGTWQVLTPLVLDGDLHIEAGAELSFAPNAYLIIKGNLVVTGTEEAPVIFKPVSENWKGLYVLEGQKGSRLEHVVIRKTEALSDGLLELTGGVTFYKSPVEIVDTLFDGTEAEDALNFVKSDFMMRNVTIRRAPSDGLDSDFSNGEILTSRFEDIGGDAADFSGSQVVIDRVEFSNIHDKAVSAGEKSRLIIRNSDFSDVGVGIASKDGSIVDADHLSVQNYTLHAAMTYVKKDMFGSSELHLNQSDLGEGMVSLRQDGTELTIDGSSGRR